MLRRNLYLIILIFLVFVLAIVNWQPGTWLSGWDTLHPEFNFPLYYKRVLSFWQEHQGLGAPASQAHAAELPRLLILYPLSLFLPVSFLRYSYFFLCLVLGPLGIYYFLTQAVFSQNNSRRKPIAFIASLFYLSNLVTIQHFLVPLEMFASQFAALGWLFCFALLFLKKAKKKDLVLFALISFLSAPQAHTATLWYVYFFSLVAFLFIWIIFQSKKIKPCLLLIFITLLINCFWLLPNLYFIKNHAFQVQNSHIHSLFSQDAFLNSVQYSTFKDLFLFKNFLFNWHIFDFSQGKFVELLGVWKIHQQLTLVKAIGYSCFFLAGLGLVLSFFKKQKIFYFSLSSSFFLACFFLLTIEPPLGFIFSWLQKTLPFFSEAFRFPFTKFSLLLIFSSAVFLSFSLNAIAGLISKKIKKPKLILTSGFLFLVFSLIYYFWPAYKGQFISPQMKINFPSAYFELFDWFEDKKGRIAPFPLSSMWGWQYYRWGYQGAGFLWFGLSQPLLDREFDRWHPTNEQYFYEISQAIYSKDLALLESVLEKYQINWLVLDKNIIDLGDFKALYFKETEDLFSRSAKIKFAKEFGLIKTYQVNLDTPVKDFVFLVQDLPQVNNYSWNNHDTAFLDYGHYLSADAAKLQADQLITTNNAPIFYPFRSLFTGRQQNELEFDVREGFNSFIFSSQLLTQPLNFQPLIPSLSEEEIVFWTTDLQEIPLATPSVEIKNNRVGVKIDKRAGYFSYDSLDDNQFFQLKPQSCNPFNTGKMERRMVDIEGYRMMRFESLGSSNCLSLNLPWLMQKTGYLVKVQSHYSEGKSLSFSILNETSKNTVIETELPKDRQISWFIIRPQQADGMGYSLHFDNISIGRQKTVNDLGRVEVYPIPYQFLKSIKLISTLNSTHQQVEAVGPFAGRSSLGSTTQLSVNDVYHPNPSFYKISLDSSLILNTNYLILSQSYHPGWLAFYQDEQGKYHRLTDHVLVNNWQNGWILPNIPPNQLVIYLFFWPQLLEYLGFVLLGGFIVFIVFKKK